MKRVVPLSFQMLTQTELGLNLVLHKTKHLNFKVIKKNSHSYLKFKVCDHNLYLMICLQQALYQKKIEAKSIEDKFKKKSLRVYAKRISPILNISLEIGFKKILFLQ